VPAERKKRKKTRPFRKVSVRHRGNTKLNDACAAYVMSDVERAIRLGSDYSVQWWHATKTIACLALLWLVQGI
jgi:hypothetical protein